MGFMKLALIMILTIGGASVTQARATFIPQDAGHADNPDDPGYDLYKSGYSAVLNEQWENACTSFRELASSFPESRYVDDAMYWTAYAQARHEQLTDAIDAYRELIDRFPDSQYFDDAVADLTEIETAVEIESLREEIESTHWEMESRAHAMREHELEKQYRRLTWHYRALAPEHSNLDPETTLRIEALRALEPSAGDEESLDLLVTVAADRANPTVLRVNAVHVLGSVNEKALPVLVSIAKNDTGEVRTIALAYIAEAPSETSVDALIDVFRTIPESDGEMTAQVFYSIAEVGNDSAVDFLATVATNHSDLNLRRDAVYYLGAIGSDRARTALRGILLGR